MQKSMVASQINALRKEKKKKSCFFANCTCFFFFTLDRLVVFSRVEQQQPIFLKCCCSFECNVNVVLRKYWLTVRRSHFFNLLLLTPNFLVEYPAIGILSIHEYF
jgi:hypothetical protein